MDAAELWAGGDYAQVAPHLEPAADAVVAAAGIGPGHRVLDVAAGTGNATIAAARAGAHVTATDIAPAMIALGRERTAGLDVRWQEADAQALPFDDGAFDRTISVFGAMFAPDPARTAAELVRVTAPDGVVVITAWTPDGANYASSKAIAARMPGGGGPATMVDRWGQDEHARAIFTDAGAAEVTTERLHLHWSFPSAEDWVRWYSESPPPAAAARKALGEERWAEIAQDLLVVAGEHGEQTPEGFTITAPYLVIAARPGRG